MSFTWYSTAEQVARDISLSGKNVIITGANTGIGKETARVIAMMDATVFMACRDPKRGNDAVEEIRKITGKKDVHFMQLDLSSLESIRHFAAEYQAKEEKLDILINNAGVMACPQSKTKDGFELQFGTNHLGHFLLTNLLVPQLEKAAPSRVVNLSSLAHKFGVLDFENLNAEQSYGRWAAYGQSKLANILFAQELNKRFADKGAQVTSYSLHPGSIVTELQRSFPFFVNWFLYPFSKSIPQGAATTVYCATAPEVLPHAGKYFSDSKLATPKQTFISDENAKKLWEVSEKLVQLKPEEKHLSEGEK